MRTLLLYVFGLTLAMVVAHASVNYSVKLMNDHANMLAQVSK